MAKPKRAVKRSGPPAAASSSPPDGTAPTPPPNLSDEEVEAALLTGEHEGALRDYFGEAEYDELRQLKEKAALRSVRGGARVLILPGIMGSRLSVARQPFDDLIWFDPFSIRRGGLAHLSYPGAAGKRVVASGVILLTYLTLKLRLALAGFDADFFPYDWRLPLADLGGKLADKLAAERASSSRKVMLVAHSMGGLVARAALPHLRRRNIAEPDRVVMLGTPNAGSYAPVQAFRGKSGTVEKIDGIDKVHNAEQLAGIFGGFPGLLHMIPATTISSSNLFDLAAWPTSGVRPERTLLAAADQAQGTLPADFSELVLVCGVNRDTVVDARIEGDEFVYSCSRDGDGTVPLASVRLPSVPAYYVEAEHGALPNDGRVQAALPSLLDTGQTEKLPNEYTPSRSGLRTVSESQLAAAARAQAPSDRPSIRQARHLLDEFAAPARVTDGFAGAVTAVSTSPRARRHSSQRITVGRGRQHRLDITLARGSITASDASCYAIGVFKNVEHGGSGAAVNDALDGALADFVRRRMFGANVGEISVLPRGRHMMRAECVAVAGLGPFDRFDPSVLEIAGENLMRTCAAARIDDLATVLVGAGSMTSPEVALGSLLTGMFQGLRDADRGRRFRSLTICETDDQRFAAVRDELFRLTATDLCDDFEVEVQEAELRSPVTRGVEAELPSRQRKAYLIVRHDRDLEGRETFTSSVLPTGAGAAVAAGRRVVEGTDKASSQLDALLAELPQIGNLTVEGLEAFSEGLTDLVLAPNVRQVLERSNTEHLVIVHDAGASRVPWELLRVNEKFLALEGGISHRYEAADFSVAKWSDERRRNATLNVLLVIDPTADLAGAVEEGVRIQAILDGMGPGVSYQRLFQQEARRQKLLDCFSSGEFDVIHYAGHAFFDATVHGQSGLLCADHEVLSGRDLGAVRNLPSLMFFNACEAARIRKAPVRSRSGEALVRATRNAEQVERGLSFAEALLRGGVANFLGTYWPVQDKAAAAFGPEFYRLLMSGAALNDALSAGRAAAKAAKSNDWADYVFYGDPDFRVKLQ